MKRYKCYQCDKTCCPQKKYYTISKEDLNKKVDKIINHWKWQMYKIKFYKMLAKILNRPIWVAKQRKKDDI